jgi:hypothetical protein
MTALQEAIEDMLLDSEEKETVVVSNGDDSRARLSVYLLNRLRGQGPRNEELPQLDYHCGPYGRERRNRGGYRK